MLQDQDMYSKYDNEEFEGYEKTNPSFKDTLIYREVQIQWKMHFTGTWLACLDDGLYIRNRSQHTFRTAGRVITWRSWWSQVFLPILWAT